MRNVALALALGLVAWSARSEEGACAASTKLSGICFEVHGRLQTANGEPPFRIWRVGTKRVLGVRGGESPMMPSALADLVGLESRVYADFEVCPFTESRDGEMQMVCIESATNVVVETVGKDSEAPTVRVLSGEFHYEK